MSTLDVQKNSRSFHLGLTLILSLILLLGLLLTMSAAQISRGTGYAASCLARLNDGDVYLNVQEAVNASTQPSDVIKVSGYCTGVNSYGGLAQVVYLSKTLTLRGGYTSTNWNVSNPISYPTTLDAQGQGRVLYVTGNISPTLEGLRIIGGDADVLGGVPWGSAVGGGVYIVNATAIMSNNQVFSNTAHSGGGLYLSSSALTLTASAITSNTSYVLHGGGLYLANSSATLSGNTINANTADERGGGLCLFDSEITLDNNTIALNIAGLDGSFGFGGGLYLRDSDATLTNNRITTNTLAISKNSDGGGLYLVDGNIILNGNVVSGNSVNEQYGNGGGLYLAAYAAALNGNIITANTADTGGGLYLLASNATLNANTFNANTASRGGGGLTLYRGQITFTGNTVSDNYAIIGGGLLLWADALLNENTIIANTGYCGSGLEVEDSSPTLINTIIADNQIYPGCSSGALDLHGDSSVHLLHSTIARNHGDGSGIYVGGSSSITMINTILVSHTLGISIAAGGTAMIQATLWGTDGWANGTDWGGAGDISTGTINLWGNPDFVGVGDYHIGPSSAARDAGVDAGVSSDIDGETRSLVLGFDLGADEYWPPGGFKYVYLPLVLQGAP